MKGYCLPILALFIAWGQHVLAQSGTPAAGARRPNIIFILSDDHAYQAISAYGSQLARTPNIDRIAREGALFTRAMVTNSICGPSRASLMTGKYSHKNGYTLNERKFNTDQPVFTDLLHNSGYQTAWIGKWHLGNLPRGLDYFRILNGQGEYYNPDLIGPADTVRMEGYVTDIITQLTEKWLDGRDASKPFCLIVGEKATHREWVPDTTDLGAYDDKVFPLPSSFHDLYEGRLAAAQQDMTIAKTLRLKEDLKVHVDYDHDGNFDRLTPAQKKPLYNYYENKISKEFDSRQDTGEVLLEWKYQRFLRDYLSVARSLDRNIGRLLAYLDEKGLANNTVVIYASDQGFYLGEHGWFDKRWIYEESLRTPFVMRYPGVIRPGSRVSAITLNVDWAPTLLDICGIKPPPDMQGVSFLPLVDGRGKGMAWRKAMYYHYYEYPLPHHVSPHFGIRTEHWVLVRFYGPADFWELYDLDTDPEELNNLYGRPGYGPTEEKLKAQLKDLIRQYDDKDALQILQQGVDTTAHPGMVRIPGGTYRMGDDGPEAKPDESPIHTVTVSDFWMDTSEVTNAEFAAFVKATGYITTAEKRPDWNKMKQQLPPGTARPDDSVLVPGAMVFTPTSYPVPLNDYSQWWSWAKGADWKHPQGPGSDIRRKDQYPVVQVSWEDARAYCQWAGKRLPTEAEWEFAARGGLKDRQYSWGDEAVNTGGPKGNFWDGHFPDHNTCMDHFAGLAPVASFPPNGYRLYDMAGNVWEWCADYYSSLYYRETDLPGGIGNPQGPASSYDPDEPYAVQRVIRGGSFLCNSAYCSGFRVSCRMKSTEDSGLENVGFRCVSDK